MPASAVPSFEKENGVRLTSAAIQGATGAAYPLRLFYIRGSSEVFSGVTVAGNEQGLAVTEEAGVRISSVATPLDIAISSITGFAVLTLDDGGFRAVYSVIGTTGSYRIYTASSANGLAWGNSSGTVVDGGTTFVGGPSLVELQDGRWQMNYIADFNGGNNPADYRIHTAFSSNEGRNWGAGSVLLSTQAHHVASFRRTDNKVRLFYTTPLPGGTSSNIILSAISADANASSFSFETGFILTTGAATGSLAFPFVVRSTDAWRSRLYWQYLLPSVSTGDAHSAANFAPDPQTNDPTIIFNSGGTAQISVTGEVFSTGALGALLRRSGQADVVGAGLVRTDDGALSAVFNVNLIAPGLWDLVVTNDTGRTGTRSDAVLIDFPGGSVEITDNLFRPRSGGRAKIDTTIFEAGSISLNLYSLDGQLVASLFNGLTPTGTKTVFWDGRNAQGATVASGVYVLHATGPKLNVRQKIIVIK